MFAFTKSNLVQTAMAASAILATEAIALDALKDTSYSIKPWTCYDLEFATDPFYRMFPAYIGTSRLDDTNTKTVEGLIGRCFLDIDVKTALELNKEETELSAYVNFELKESLGLCIEHL